MLTLKVSYQQGQKILNSKFAPLFELFGVTVDCSMMYFKTSLNALEIDIISGLINHQ